MARGHVGIVVGVQSGFSALCDMWRKVGQGGDLNTETFRLHQSEVETVENIRRLIALKRICDQSRVSASFALPNSDQLGMLAHFFQFVGEPLKSNEAVRIEAIQNLPIKNFLYAPLDLTSSRFVEQIARLTLLCPKIDHVVLSAEPKWNHASLVALKESWKWISPLQADAWNSWVKEVSGKSLEELQLEVKKDPLSLTRSQKMKKLLEIVDRVIESEKPLMIVGEEGVGKELVFQRMHAQFRDKNMGVESVDCTQIVPDLSNLPTQATSQVIILNAFDKLSESDQENLISYMLSDEVKGRQVKWIFEIQGQSEQLAPFCQNAEVLRVEVPALRNRKEDLELLIDYFIQKFNIEKKKKISGLSRRAIRSLAAYDWPGNVRELEALIERCVVIKASGIIDVCDIPEKFVETTLSEIEYDDILRGANKRLAPQGTLARKEACYDQMQGEEFKMSNNSFFKGHIDQMAANHACDSSCQHEMSSSFTNKEGVSSMQKIEEFLDMLQSGFKCTDEGVDFNTIVDRFENILILAALARTGWNRNRAAALLKLNRTTLVEKLKKKQLAQPGAAPAVTPSTTAPISF